MSRLFKTIILFLLTVLIIPVAIANWQLKHQEYNVLAKCINHLIYDQNTTYSQNIRISLKFNPELRFIAGDIIDGLRKFNNHDDTFELLEKSGTKHLFETHLRILIIDSSNSFRSLLNRQRQNSFDHHGVFQYYFIILINYQANTNSVEEILDFCFQKNIVNVNVLIEDSPQNVSIYTYYPFLENNCRNSIPTLHNRFQMGKLEWNRPVFPKKLNNLWRCPIRVVTWHKPPFIFFEHGEEMSGIDWNFVVFLSKAMNFTIEVSESPDGLGQVFPNGTMKGAFQMMEDAQGDFTVGGTICSKPRRKYLACTTNYYSTSLQIIVKKPNPYSSFEILLFPFDSKTWFTFLVLLFGNLIIRILWKRIVRTFKGKRMLSTRIQIVSWLLSIFIIRSSYEGSIFNFLHNRPIPRVPQDFEEALADGYKFVAKSSYFPLIKHIPELVDKLILSNISLTKIVDEFDRFNGKYALINLDNFLIAIANDTAKYEHYLGIRKPILYNMVCVYLPKFSYLTKEFNNQIKRMINHGHMQKIYDISVTDKLRKIQSNSGNIVHTMPMHEIVGAFQLLLGLMGVGACILLAELAATKSILVKKIMNFFH